MEIILWTLSLACISAGVFSISSSSSSVVADHYVGSVISHPIITSLLLASLLFAWAGSVIHWLKTLNSKSGTPALWQLQRGLSGLLLNESEERLLVIAGAAKINDEKELDAAIMLTTERLFVDDGLVKAELHRKYLKAPGNQIVLPTDPNYILTLSELSFSHQGAIYRLTGERSQMEKLARHL